MKYLITTLFIFTALVFGADPAMPSQEGTWSKESGEHFVIYFMQDASFAREVLNKAEVYYRRIALELGYPRYSEFWIWDKRVKIYIYPDHEAFLKATGQPSWSHGMADYRKMQIISYAWSRDFLESLLPHEIGHLVFRDFVGFKGEVPLWLDEGVAQWCEEAKRPQIKQMARDFMAKDALISLNDMMKLDLNNINAAEKVHIYATRTKTGERGILFLSADNLISTYYLQAASIVGFLIERQGSDNFAHFCRGLRDGKTLEEALAFAYPVQIRNINELEDKWREYLKGG